MYKVIKIEGNRVFVGKDNGDFVEIDRSKFSFEPQIGDLVDYYQSGDEIIVSKAVSNVAGVGKVGDKSKIVAALLAFFVGTFGIHNFYLGYTAKGVAQLLLTVLGWIIFIGPFVSAVWAFIEAILIIISKPGTDWHKDADGFELQD